MIALALLLGICLHTGATEPPKAGGFPVLVQGQVVDDRDEPLPGVTVGVFIEGLLQTQTRSGADGSYALGFEVDPQREETVLLFCVPARPDLAPDVALVRESREDRDARLWSPCVPRLGVRPTLAWSPRIGSPQALRERLAGSGCAGS